MKTAIRLDDFTPDMNFTNFIKIRQILEKADIKPLIGVVPYSKDDTLRIEKPHENFDDILGALQQKGWTIALHGYNHLYTTRSKGIFPINNFSEYAGVDYDKQLVMIREGKLQLEHWGVEPKLFMAPGHTFDKNTLKALKACSIYKITDGFGNKPYIRDEITFYPISKKRSECISDIEGYSTYVLHTNTMTDKDIDAFEKMINENREHFIDYSEYLSVEPIKRGALGNAKEYMLALAKHLLISRRASKGTVIHSN